MNTSIETFRELVALANALPSNTCEINFREIMPRTTNSFMSSDFRPLWGDGFVWLNRLTVIGVSSRFPCRVGTMITKHAFSEQGAEEIQRDMRILEDLLARAKAYYLQVGADRLYPTEEAIDVLNRQVAIRFSSVENLRFLPQLQPTRKFYLGGQEIPLGLYEYLKGLDASAVLDTTA